MAFLAALWLPITLAAVFVFIGSSILHMVLRYHRSDYKQLPHEDSILSAIRASGAAPGMHMFPYAADPKEIKSPAMAEKFRQGPVGQLILTAPGPMNLGKCLGMWFVFCLLVSVATAKICFAVMPAGIPYINVFKVAGGVSFMSYCLAHFQDSVWLGRPWSVTIKHMIDGVILACITAGTFGWLWPR